MLVTPLSDCVPFVAGDGSLLRELLHPDKAPLDIRYSLAHATVPPGQATKTHRLTMAEVYYIMEGTGTMVIDDESQAVDAGCAVYIPPGAVQSLENHGVGNLVFLCIVDPAWHEEDEAIIDSPQSQADTPGTEP